MNVARCRSASVSLVLSLLCFLIASVASASEFVVTSPDSQLRAVISLRKGALSYRLEMLQAGAWQQVIRDSPLGLKLEEADFTRFKGEGRAGAASRVEEKYTMLTGKRRECATSATAQTLTFSNPKRQVLELDVRVSRDGLAYRYRIPGAGGTIHTLESEISGFALPADARVWCAPSDKATMYSPAYETYYVNGVPAGGEGANTNGWSFPLLFRSDSAGAWALITEANLDETFCASRLANKPEGTLYRLALPDPLEGNGVGNIHPQSSLPWTMPWRVIITGPSLATIVESTLVQDVSEPNRLTNTSWIKPGRVAWSWWSDNPSPRSAAKQKRFVDLAAEMGWEYLLVDANWTIMNDGNFQDVIRYAGSKNVGVLLWYNSGGPHNIVTEKPRDTLTYPSVRQFELGLLKEWGVKGIKVDFFQSDKQEVIQLYRGLLTDSADKQVMINFHGCTLPRGWQRTFPHLMAMEAVRGEECYIFDPKYPEQAPVQNTILPFARNVVGSMDYTPVGFSDNKYPHLTTSAHELALTVVFESGWLHFADKPEAYLALPDEPKQFLKEVPVTWDETRFVQGYPGQFAVLARRHGKTWFVAGINAAPEPRDLLLEPGTFTGPGALQARLIGDGPDARSFAASQLRVESGATVPVRLAGRGGFVMVLQAAP